MFFFYPYLLQTIESKIVLLVYHCFSFTHRVLYAECSFYIFGTLFSAQVLLFDTTEMPVALNCTLRTCCILLRSLSKCKFSHSPIVYTWILLTHTESIYGAVCNLAVCADFVSYLCCVYAYGHGMWRQTTARNWKCHSQWWLGCHEWEMVTVCVCVCWRASQF